MRPARPPASARDFETGYPRLDLDTHPLLQLARSPRSLRPPRGSSGWHDTSYHPANQVIKFAFFRNFIPLAEEYCISGIKFVYATPIRNHDNHAQNRQPARLGSAAPPFFYDRPPHPSPILQMKPPCSFTTRPPPSPPLDRGRPARISPSKRTRARVPNRTRPGVPIEPAPAYQSNPRRRTNRTRAPGCLWRSPRPSASPLAALPRRSALRFQTTPARIRSPPEPPPRFSPLTPPIFPPDPPPDFPP